MTGVTVSSVGVKELSGGAVVRTSEEGSRTAEPSDVKADTDTGTGVASVVSTSAASELLSGNSDGDSATQNTQDSTKNITKYAFVLSRFILVSILSFVAPEKECYGSGTSVATDGGADMINLYLAVEFWEFCFN